MMAFTFWAIPLLYHRSTTGQFMNIQGGSQQYSFRFRGQIADGIQEEKEIGRSKIEDFNGAKEKERASGTACSIGVDSYQEIDSSPTRKGQENVQKTSQQLGLVECRLEHVLGLKI